VLGSNDKIDRRLAIALTGRRHWIDTRRYTNRSTLANGILARSNQKKRQIPSSFDPEHLVAGHALPQ
jgi:hypothetical protein